MRDAKRSGFTIHYFKVLALNVAHFGFVGLAAFISGCAGASSTQLVEQSHPSDFDRAAAVIRIESYLKQDEAWAERYRPLKLRKRAGEDVEAQIQALGERPDFASIQKDADRIVAADPTDDAAFLATEVALRGNQISDLSRWTGSSNEVRQRRLTQALLTSHIHRPNFRRAVYLYFSDPRESVAFWEQVLALSPHREVRAGAAVKVVAGYFDVLGLSDLSARQRQDARREMERHVQLIREDYADIGNSSAAIQRYLSALNYSVGATLPDVEVATVNGGTDALSKYQGKTVLLDFWATWCGPCKKGHPELIALKNEMKGKPFEIIGISVDVKPEVVTRYLAELNLPWPQWYVGPQGKLLKSWGISSYPTYLLLDADGIVQARGDASSLDSIKNQARKLVERIDARRSSTALRVPGSPSS